MLTLLRIKNLALVESIRIEFQPGFNIITGETGAGKSILIGALSLLLGERADRTLIRSGEDACGAEAVFELADPAPVNAVLAAAGLEPCAENQLLIRRVVRANGSGQTTVNDSPVTLPVLKQLGNLLVDMHGPHDHQSLLDPAAQLDLLDAFGHLREERAAFGAGYAGWCELRRRREELAAAGGNVTEQLAMLEYKIHEIETAAPKPDEEEQIVREHALASNAQRILELAQRALEPLSEGQPAAFALLTEAGRALEELKRMLPEAEEWAAQLRQTCALIQELGRDIQRTAGKIEADPGRLRWLDERLSVYQQLKRKYGGTVETVLAALAEAKTRRLNLATRDEQLAALDTELARDEAALRSKGLALRKKREAVAGKLAAAITRELKSLGFGQAAFTVDLAETEPGALGMDSVEFGFAPNVGEAMRPLRMIASSGEMSRVMLATKAVLARHDRVPVLVFDEIDANIGGETGQVVGRKLARVAAHHQVLCITHLPQVAVHGAHHFAVSKYVREGRTFTAVAALDGPARVDEIARMLGGRDQTNVTLEHARQMLAQAAAAG